MRDNQWVRLLAYVTGLVNQRLLLQCEYLIAENRILRSHLQGKPRLSNPERCTLAEIGKRLGRQCLAEVACVAKPDTILAWYRRLIARKFDGSQHRSYPGRPRLAPAVEALIVRMAQENSTWDTIASPGHWPISVTAFPIKRLAMFSNGTASHPHRNAAKTQIGRTSFQRTWPS